MNEQDSVLITRFPLSKLGTSTSKSTLENRQAALEKQLYDDLPIRQLRACHVEFELATDHRGLWMLVFLTRSVQLNLQLSDPKGTREDLFLDEVRWICNEQSKLRESYEHALKSSTDPRIDPALVIRRGRLRSNQRAGQLWIPSNPDGEMFEFTPPPQTMAHAHKIHIRFKVVGVYKRDCRIAVHEILTDTAKTYLESRRDRPWKVFRRDQCIGEMAGQQLTCSVDTDALLEATGQIEFSWVDASVERISLTGFPTPCSLAKLHNS